MAFKKPNFDFFGFTTDVYVKISQVLIVETGTTEDGKNYTVKVLLSWFTNDTKERQFSQTEVTLEGLKLEELDLASIYGKLAHTEDFKDFVNVP